MVGFVDVMDRPNGAGTEGFQRYLKQGIPR